MGYVIEALRAITPVEEAVTHKIFGPTVLLSTGVVGVSTFCRSVEDFYVCMILCLRP